MRIEYEHEIKKPPGSVFPWIAEPEKAIRWQKNVQGGEILVDTPERVGTMFTETIEEQGRTLEMRGTITRYIEDQIIAFHIESRVHAFDVSYSLEATEAGTKISIVTDIRWRFPLNLLSVIMGRKVQAGIRDQLEAEVRELKTLCEAEGEIGLTE